MDDELIEALARISQLTGMPIDELIRLAVLELVPSFDLDFAGAKNEVSIEALENE
jgi:hypothetical protein